MKPSIYSIAPSDCDRYGDWGDRQIEALTIFSKDIDFYDRALLYGPPPQIVHVGVRNCSNARLP